MRYLVIAKLAHLLKYINQVIAQISPLWIIAPLNRERVLLALFIPFLKYFKHPIGQLLQRHAIVFRMAIITCSLAAFRPNPFFKKVVISAVQSNQLLSQVFHHFTSYIFNTSSPKWLMTFTAIFPFLGGSKGRLTVR